MIQERSKFRFSRYRPFIRNVNCAWLLEIFFVTSVATIVLIRLFLHFTNYPKVSPGDLHIAHVLIGGFFMLAAIVMLLVFLDDQSKEIASLIGGFGFGAFIDELGKFVTRENNYFYEPTFAMLYVIFVILFLIFESINSIPNISHQERIVNALEVIKKVPLGTLDTYQKTRALYLLEDCSDDDSLVHTVRKILSDFKSKDLANPGLYLRLKTRARHFYRKIIQKSWFTSLVVLIFILQSLFHIGGVLMHLSSKIEEIQSTLDYSLITAFDLLEIISPIVASVFVVIGIINIKKSRLVAYRHFKTSILIHILIIDAFQFYRIQHVALVGLCIDIFILGIVRYMIFQEIGARSSKPNLSV